MFKAWILAVGIVIGAFLNAPANAQDTAIEGVIQSQLDAFQQDDFATAFTFASPTIRGMFGTADRFGMMVRNGYPMVWRPEVVDFLEMKERGPLRYQSVLIQGADGVPHVLEYEMIQVEGDWKINGVRFLRAPSVGA